MFTCIGNKRKLIGHIRHIIVEDVRSQLGKGQLNIVDGFAGSGVVSRALSYVANTIYSNDLEYYSYLMAECFLKCPPAPILQLFHSRFYSVLTQPHQNPKLNIFKTSLNLLKPPSLTNTVSPSPSNGPSGSGHATIYALHKAVQLYRSVADHFCEWFNRYTTTTPPPHACHLSRRQANACAEASATPHNKANTDVPTKFNCITPLIVLQK